MLYFYEREPQLDTSLPEDHVMKCTPAPQTENVPESEKQLCLLLYRRGSRVTFSGVRSPSELEKVKDDLKRIKLWSTYVLFDVAGRERELASKVVFHIARGETDEVELRRKVFTREGKGDCQFRTQIDATELSKGLLFVTALAWITSFLVFGVSLIFQWRIFFDMSNPLHWAQKAVVGEDFDGTGNAVASSVDADGQRFVILSSEGDLNPRGQSIINLFRQRHDGDHGTDHA
ncbi:hypothetical protein FGB62_110g14 [Gracilaria domingensis]|nr:hypothetical protein FGB62_110g14 [Gracilaria domingensis]